MTFLLLISDGHLWECRRRETPKKKWGIRLLPSSLSPSVTTPALHLQLCPSYSASMCQPEIPALLRQPQPLANHHYFWFQSVPSEFAGTMGGNRHYSNGPIKGPLPHLELRPVRLERNTKLLQATNRVTSGINVLDKRPPSAISAACPLLV